MKRYERNSVRGKVILTLLTPEEVEKEGIKIEKVSQVSGVCFDREGKVLIISSKPGKWGIPGGKPENSESFEQTLKREVEEEACVTIGKSEPLAFVKVNFKNNSNKSEGDLFYQARYISLINSVNELKEDPATGIKFERKFIDINNFLDYVKWQDAKDLIELAKIKFLTLKNEK